MIRRILIVGSTIALIIATVASLIVFKEGRRTELVPTPDITVSTPTPTPTPSITPTILETPKIVVDTKPVKVKRQLICRQVRCTIKKNGVVIKSSVRRICYTKLPNRHSKTSCGKNGKRCVFVHKNVTKKAVTPQVKSERIRKLWKVIAPMLIS